MTLDELSFGLMPSVVENVLESVAEINRRGVTVPLAEQMVQDALGIASRGYVIKSRCVTGHGTQEELLASGEASRAYYWNAGRALTSSRWRGGGKMKGIVTVLGKDSVGIIAKVCAYMSERNVNVLDIAQTIVDGYFNMMMVVDISRASEPLVGLASGLEDLGREIGVVVRLQHEDIFNAMHRI